ncbi:RISC-loading complex subunit TARBP2-like [Vespa mandarinia]|uniref:RISC-loading complex subunit TARBP2-like n=1 Tax=Vespa mandarinia TaxID=7446 RepID=UPI00161144F4|nr:RISC-loading complex subunit TARBP2-like [Vespa mandarinia]XP_035720462.1 RISC-loading complex subunit TARBP2-like [Vespa mandarinia]XP_035720463.1 RISC-loading complex subunit TARBP2-like [Vespa mandarinia]XP_035720464.1 RISC-loading complex subunit TARBP2-like [Vespa mandarinia]XP_035720465.1 RISC-loading complex subunit TARBP2-like [Vespa mandarinia]XP_046826999.1 RISC-loading complex subunit TARBP2-like [Vespa crabro]XP_046827000.1 RISC-loading complex subunit TARBP2-like [Vespa crabro
MSKTPVSILQEMMVKMQMIPNYELIHDGGGTHVNTFTYRVTCEGLSATGTGRSKKDAKHEAAKAMLEKIAAHRAYPQLPASPAQSPIKTCIPTVIPASPRIPPNEPFVNAIGALQTLCAENNLQEPEYIPINDEGPPHARIFTYQCVLSTFKEEGIATTKKQAKHEAAKKMLNRIKELVSVNYPEFLDNDEQSQLKINDMISNSIAEARYPQLNRFSSKKVNLGLKISDYHIKLKNSFMTIRQELLTNLQSIRHDTSDYNMVNTILYRLQEILTPLAIQVTITLLNSINPDIFVVSIETDTSPSIVQCSSGTTKKEAEYKAVLNLIDSIILLLK